MNDVPASEGGFGIYLHWPFCLAKCPYCDFNSHVSHTPVDWRGFVAAHLRELTGFCERTPGRRVGSIFFGGGTPSLMPPEAVATLIDAIAKLWPMRPDVEITLEANPTSAEARNFAGYRMAGVNRLSVGVQSLIDADLEALGRRHSAEEAIAAYRLAARIFPATSFDLIYARPGQSPDHWRRELKQALAEQHGHMSLYQLTIEPDTAFARLHASGRLTLPDDDRAADLYSLTGELTAAAGLEAYEVSNYAAPEKRSRHNLLYWRYGEYIGVGPGAHSRLCAGDGRRFAVNMLKQPEIWRQSALSTGNGIETESEISLFDQAREFLLMGLRLSEGVDLDRLERLTGMRIEDALAKTLLDDGMLRPVTQNRIAASERGRLVLNALVGELCRALVPVETEEDVVRSAKAQAL